MNENMHGATPNNGESKPENPVGDQNNMGSEPAETEPAAEKNTNQAKDKKQRRTDAELFAALQKKLAEVADKQRKVKGRLEEKRAKELVKFKLVIGDASLNYLKTHRNSDNARRLIDLLRRFPIDRDKSWVNEHFDRLIKEHTEPKPTQDGANGESPSPS